MSERKTLTITQVEEIKKVGDKQIPKLSFRAKDGDKELTYFTFKTSLFDLISEGQTINADVETSTREWEDQTYTDRRIVQIYVDGQPVNIRGGYRGKSPEELELSARAYALSYAKDLAVADKIIISSLTKYAQEFYDWMKPSKQSIVPPPNVELETKERKAKTRESNSDKAETIDINAMKFKNPGEFYTACLEHFKLTKSKVDTVVPEYDLNKPDQRNRAWETIVAIYGAREEG